MGELLDCIRTMPKLIKGERNLSLLPVVIAYDGNDAYEIVKKLNSNCTDEEKEQEILGGYGKHSENIGADAKINDLENFQYYCPVLLICNLEHIKPNAIKNIYPFSVEDFELEPIVKKVDNIEDYSLGKQVRNILDYIEYLFGSNEAYLSGDLKAVEENNKAILVIKQLYTRSLNAKVKTIYVDFKNLQKIDENIECIIYPERLNMQTVFSTLSSRFGVETITYKTNTTKHPAWYNYEAARLLEEYLRKEGKLESEEI